MYILCVLYSSMYKNLYLFFSFLFFFSFFFGGGGGGGVGLTQVIPCKDYNHYVYKYTFSNATDLCLFVGP